MTVRRRAAADRADDRAADDVGWVELEVRAWDDPAGGWAEDDLVLGADPQPPPAWRARLRPTGWSWRQRAISAVGVGLAAVLAAAVVAPRLDRPGPEATGPGPVPSPLLVRAPGADVSVPLDTEPSWCPPQVPCTTTDTVGRWQLAAFHAAFPSAGYIGSATVVGTYNGVVYRQVLRFSTGTLVTVTLTQQPVIMLSEPPVVDATPTARDLDSGSLELTALRDGYLLTASLAGLPGQVLPVGSARRWLETVPSAGPAVS